MGYWGALEDVLQTSSPKYDALPPQRRGDDHIRWDHHDIGRDIVLGAVLGAMLGAIAADKTGRKRAFLLDMATIAAGSALCVLASDPSLIVVGQFVIGASLTTTTQVARLRWLPALYPLLKTSSEGSSPTRWMRGSSLGQRRRSTDYSTYSFDRHSA
jgi:hypothetical protein